MFSSAPRGPADPDPRRRKPRGERACVREGSLRWPRPLLYPSLCEQERKWVWRLEVPQGSHLVPLPSWLMPLSRYPPSPSVSSPPRACPALAGWHLSPEARAPVFCWRREPPQQPLPGNQRCRGAVSAHLNASLSLSLSVLGLPGPAPGGPGLGVQPPPAAHAAAHLPGGGPLLHQQAQAGRVAGTLEKGGEEPSGRCPDWPHVLGKPDVRFSHPRWLWSGPG